MIELVVASAIHIAMFQSAAADSARSALRTCFKEAAAEAKSQKLTSEAFAAFARQKCETQQSSFKSAVWAFDSKNKVPKKQSEADANLQIDDFLTSAADRYTAENSPQ